MAQFRLVTAEQFAGLADYRRILAWMEAAGSPLAVTGEVSYEGPGMRFGGQIAHPGDWVVHDGDEWLVCRHNRFAALYEAVG
jgi:hypothetical protein